MSKSLLNFSQENPLKKMKTIIMEDTKDVIAANKNYIISDTEGPFLKIENIDTKLFDIIKLNSAVFHLKFHPKFENTFLFLDDNILKIYKIIKETCKYEEIVLIQGHTKLIYLVEFSKTDENILATYSIDNTIKIWDTENAFCICYILVNNHHITKIELYNNFIFYYDKFENCIIKYDYKTFEIKEKFKHKTKEYNTFNF